MANPKAKGARVLVVDDSDTIRYGAKILLEMGGHEVTQAKNGFEALAAIEREQPDLILMDIMMPRLDGYQTCALIKRNPRYASTPVVMLSSKDNAFDRARGRLVGAHYHLSKPFTKSAILGVVAAELSPWRRGHGPHAELELLAA